MPQLRDPVLREYDAMRCRSCANEERASEGYPCASCGTFICLMCVFKGVVRCAPCEEEARKSGISKGGASASGPALRSASDSVPGIDWPEH